MLSRTIKVFGLLTLLAAFIFPSAGFAFQAGQYHPAAKHRTTVKHKKAVTHKKTVKRLTARQKKVIQWNLLWQIKHNPRMIQNRAWLRSAAIVHFSLPVTIRLNPEGAPSSNIYHNTATLALGPTMGSHQLGLTGQMHATMTFLDTFDGGQPGNASMSINPSCTWPTPGTPGTPPNCAGLLTTSVPLLTNHNVTTQPPSSNPMADGCGDGKGGVYPPIAGTADDWSNLMYSDQPEYHGDHIGSPPVSMETGAVPGDAVLRTGALAIGVAQAGTVPDGPLAGQLVGPSGGMANLFGLPVTSGAGYSVDVKVSLQTYLNAIARTVDYASQSVPVAPGVTANIDCRQVWTGYVDNILTTELVGSLRIAPAITADHYLRIARVQLASPQGGSPETVAACLVPDSFFTGNLVDPTVPPDSHVNPAPDRPCNAPSDPFIKAGLVNAFDGAPYGTPGNGSQVLLAGNMAVNSLNAEVLVGFE